MDVNTINVNTLDGLQKAAETAVRLFGLEVITIRLQ